MSLIPFVGAAQKFNRDRGYRIERSLRFNSADSAYLNRTPASAGNRKTWTWSGWVKRSGFATQDLFNAYQDDNNQTLIAFSSDALIVYTIHGGGAFDYGFQTTAVFRDPSAWYHIVAVFNSSNATAANRAIVYVNGVQQAGSMAFGDIPLNQDGIVNSTNAHSLGRRGSGSQYFGGYLTEINFIDGQALTPSSFGEFNSDTGVWQPKAYAGEYGTNGFYLNFSDNSGTTSSTLGKDQAGSNDWTPNNFSVTAGAGNDSLVDSPTRYGTDTGAGGEVRGNYATLNSAFGAVNGASNAPTNGNLDVATIETTQNFSVSTIPVSSGKWYFEGNFTGDSCTIGIWQLPLVYATLFFQNKNYRYFNQDGKIYTESGATATTYNTYTTGDVIGVALDMDNGKVYFSKNGTWQGSADPETETNPTATGLTGTWAFAVQAGSTSGSIWSANFGQRPFSYTAPSGFKALVTTNLPTPTIEKGGEYFNPVLYTGNSSGASVTGVGFQPDFVWMKCRNTTRNHELLDVVRGGSSTLFSNLTNAEATQQRISSFDADGFTYTTDSNSANAGDTFVAWNWKANGAGVTNTNGTITSTVSVNTTSGFSIVTFTDPNNSSNYTVGHGLNVTPSMIIVKERGTTGSWVVWHSAATTTVNQFLLLNSTAATGTQANIWGANVPTSTVFGLKSGGTVDLGDTVVAYCFAPVAGYSAFGSWTGNGSADGPFVFVNHRPAFVMIKRTDTTSNWTILDFQREGYNVDNDPLFPNLTNAEGTTDLADLLSNGFKLRSTDASVNASGGTYIYMSIATNPFQYALAR
jgi:hypothetical protein